VIIRQACFRVELLPEVALARSDQALCVGNLRALPGMCPPVMSQPSPAPDRDSKDEKSMYDCWNKTLIKCLYMQETYVQVCKRLQHESE
jgi:hypothetical protein